MTNDLLTELRYKLYRARPPKLLYHYTSIEGLKGIVDSKSLWASNIHFLNDAHEIGHAIGLLRGQVQSRIPDAHGAAGKLLEQLNQYLHPANFKQDLMFVVSFTECDDDLSQWRGYCKTGTGVCAGFESEHLSHQANAQTFLIGRCIYELAQQQEIITFVLDSILKSAAANPTAESNKADPSQTFFDFFRQFQIPLLLTAALLKHRAFINEREWRLVSPIFENYREAPIDYRAGKSMMIPYINFSIDNKGSCGLRHLHIGPGPNLELSQRSISMFLAKYGIRDGEWFSTQPSAIPYRDW